MIQSIRGNRVLHADGSLNPATFSLDDGKIEAVTNKSISGADLDAGDLLVLPGVVDLHGDAFERQIHPRPRIGVPPAVGLLETDRQMIANGITTAFHGLTVTWEPGSRDIKSAHSLLDAMERVRPRLVCDTKIHLRHEALSLDTVDECCHWIQTGRVDLLALNDHREMVLRSLARGVLRDSVSMHATHYRELAESMLAREAEVPGTLRKLTLAAQNAGIPLASHDDDTPEARAQYRAMGCTICEFPADELTAGSAREAGEDIILGGPNILRGGSHCGRVGAAEMIRHGLCTVLCSDYFYPAILVAPFMLAAHDVVPFPVAWDLVSSGPARAAKLNDRGELSIGKRADFILVDDRDPMNPEVRAAFVNGVPVYQRAMELASVSLAAQ